MFFIIFLHFLQGSNPMGDSCHFKGDSLHSFTESPNRWKGLCFPGNTDRLWFAELLIILTKLIHICQLLYSVMLIIQQSENEKEHFPFLETTTFPSRLEEWNKNTFEELFLSREMNIRISIYNNSKILFSWYLSTELFSSPYKLQWSYKSLKHTTDKTWQAGIAWIIKTNVTVQNW